MPSLSLLTDILGNDLDSLSEPLVLVLDDYHLISNTDIHELLDTLLRHPPRSLHLVFVTRHDPAISLPSLRARGWVTEIRQDDLRFTQLEVNAVLRETAGISVSDATLTHLEEVLEGWIVGLHLVGLVLRNQSDPESFLLGLKGGFQQVYDYLSEQVLERQPTSLRTFLLRSSVLDRFSAPLLDAVCLPSDDSVLGLTGEEFLQQVELANLFVVPLDEQRQWFRYHHLFQDLLKRQLERYHSADEIVELHSRASHWLENHGSIGGSIGGAIGHALTAGEPVRAAEIVERRRHAEFTADRWYEVERWLAMLPTEVKSVRPKLLLTEAWIANCRFQVARIPAIIDQVEMLLGDGTTEPTVAGELAYFRGFLAYWEGQPELSQKLLEEALSQLSGKNTPYEGEAELLLGLARCMDGKGKLALSSVVSANRSTRPVAGSTPFTTCRDACLHPPDSRQLAASPHRNATTTGHRQSVQNSQYHGVGILPTGVQRFSRRPILVRIGSFCRGRHTKVRAGTEGGCRCDHRTRDYSATDATRC